MEDGVGRERFRATLIQDDGLLGLRGWIPEGPCVRTLLESTHDRVYTVPRRLATLCALNMISAIDSDSRDQDTHRYHVCVSWEI